MACGKKTNIKNLLVKLQTADAWDAPAGVNNWRLNTGMIAQASPEAISRQILKASYTPEADLTGVMVASVTGSSEMYGDDYTDGTTKPWFDSLFQSGQLLPTKLQAIPVSAIGVNFVHNEIVTGDTSGAIGRVIVPTVDTDVYVVIQTLSTGFIAETITGSISGSATATGAEFNAGWSYKFDSSSCKRLSVQAEEDSLISQMFNSVPTFTIVSDAGGIPRIEYEISGVIRDVAGVEQWMRDGVMTDLTGLRSELTPPKFVDGRLKYGTYSPIVDSTLTIDPAIVKGLRTDANNPTGAEGYILTGRAPTNTYRINTPTNAEADIIQHWFNSTAISTEFRFGSEIGNTFWFFTPTARLENVTGADQEGEMKLELQFKLTGQDDEELEIVCI